MAEFTGFLDAMLWANVQAAVLAAATLLPAVLVATALLGRLPVWRKGLWMAAAAVPAVVVAVAVLLPAGDGRLDAIRWLAGPCGSGSGSSAGSSSAGSTSPLTIDLLRSAYLMWVLMSGASEGIACVRLSRLLGRARDERDPQVLALYAHLARTVGCRRPPRLVRSDDAATPFVVARLFRGSTIVLPAGLLNLATGRGSCPLSAVLAHELAHVRANDPWWQRAAGLARVLFPLPWACGWAAVRARWEDAAEETGDLRAVRAAGLEPARYAAVLKDLALGDVDGPAADAASGRLAMAFTPAGDADTLSPAARALGLRLVRRVHGLRLAPRWSEPLAAAAGTAARGVAALVILALFVRLADLPAALTDPRVRADVTAATAPTPTPVTSAAVALPRVAQTTSPDAAELAKLPPGIRRRLLTSGGEAATGVGAAKPSKAKKAARQGG
jgi:Zn-dependent protease with chaperone function